MPQVGAQALVIVGIDTDRNADTGAIFGGDYAVVFGFEGLSLDFLRWDGSAYVDATGDVTSILAGGSVEILVHPDAIGGMTAFNFKVGVATGDPETARSTSRRMLAPGRSRRRRSSRSIPSMRSSCRRRLEPDPCSRLRS